MSQIFNKIKKSKQPFIIAEIGVNFYDIAKKQKISPLAGAKLMIKKASQAGADAVKFQSYKASTLAIKNSPAYWDRREESCKSQYELFKKFDHFGKKDYEALAAYCKKQEVIFLSTPFDFESADYLSKICPLFKISSSDLSNTPFLKYIAQKKKPVILSTGASTLKEIQKAAQVILRYGNKELALLHCILSYPTQYKDAHLTCIPQLKKLYPKRIIGYSDHTLPDHSMTTLTAATLMGAQILEKHFTLDKSLPGNDHYHAMDEEDLRNFKNNLSIMSQIIGKERTKEFTCEKQPRSQARRSIVAANTIEKGTKINEKILTYKRPAAGGLSPDQLHLVIGKIAKTKILADTQIQLKHLKRSTR